MAGQMLGWYEIAAVSLLVEVCVASGVTCYVVRCRAPYNLSIVPAVVFDRCTGGRPVGKKRREGGDIWPGTPCWWSVSSNLPF